MARFLSALVGGLLLLSTTARAADTYGVDAVHSSVVFRVKHMNTSYAWGRFNDLAERFPMIVVAQTVDKLKDAGFYWATRSGVTVSMADVLVPLADVRTAAACARNAAS